MIYKGMNKMNAKLAIKIYLTWSKELSKQWHMQHNAYPLYPSKQTPNSTHTDTMKHINHLMINHKSYK